MNSKYKTNIEIEEIELYNLKEDFKKLSDPRIGPFPLSVS